MRIGRETKIGIFVASVLIAAFSVINYLIMPMLKDSWPPIRYM